MVSTFSSRHRDLGSAFSCQDLDTVEFRDGKAVALIESTLIGKKHTTAHAVFTRFISDVKGFATDLMYMVGLALNIPAYVVCFMPCIRFADQSAMFREPFNVLHLQTGIWREMTREGYEDFIKTLGTTETECLELPQVLENLSLHFPALKDTHPYFSNDKKQKERWSADYRQRCEAIRTGKPHTKPKVIYLGHGNCKPEKTHERPDDYELLRKTIEPVNGYITIDLLEWRRSGGEQLGRPVAILKLQDTDSGIRDYQQFMKTKLATYYAQIAKKLHVPWFYVAYSESQPIMQIWKNGEKQSGKDYDQEEFKSLVESWW